MKPVYAELMAASAFAQSVTVTALTLDDAEAEVAAQAQQQGAGYTIIEASNNNVIHMTAKLHKSRVVAKRRVEKGHLSGGLFRL